jgi:hypothetical protein
MVLCYQEAATTTINLLTMPQPIVGLNTRVNSLRILISALLPNRRNLSRSLLKEPSPLLHSKRVKFRMDRFTLPKFKTSKIRVQGVRTMR